MRRGCQSCKMRPSNAESEPKLQKFVNRIEQAKLGSIYSICTVVYPGVESNPASELQVVQRSPSPGLRTTFEDPLWAVAQLEVKNIAGASSAI